MQQYNNEMINKWLKGHGQIQKHDIYGLTSSTRLPELVNNLFFCDVLMIALAAINTLYMCCVGFIQLFVCSFGRIYCTQLRG